MAEVNKISKGNKKSIPSAAHESGTRIEIIASLEATKALRLLVLERY